jgi:hypothetical protein
MDEGLVEDRNIRAINEIREPTELGGASAADGVPGQSDLALHQEWGLLLPICLLNPVHRIICKP